MFSIAADILSGEIADNTNTSKTRSTELAGAWSDKLSQVKSHWKAWHHEESYLESFYYIGLV